MCVFMCVHKYTYIHQVTIDIKRGHGSEGHLERVYGRTWIEKGKGRYCY